MTGSRTARDRQPRWRLLAVIVTAITIAAGCSSGGDHDRAAADLEEWVGGARFPVGPVALPDGGLLYGERLTGRIRRIDPAGGLAERAVASLPVVGATDDQRGLLGLARTGDGRLFASWTGIDGRLVVGDVSAENAGPRILWSGPMSADQANGGALAVASDGRLLVGIGDLLADRRLDTDPRVPNRKILELDPGGAPDQMPRVISTGWNNPYAIAIVDGAPWVADNAGGRAPERIGRADRPARRSATLRDDHETVAPAGLVDLGGRRLGVCGFVSGRLDEYSIGGDRAVRTGRVVGRPCRLGAAVLHDGRLVTLTPSSIYRSRRPVGRAG
jgi:hypothetical protein